MHFGEKQDSSKINKTLLMTLSLNRLQGTKDKFQNLNYNKMIPPPQQMEYFRMTLRSAIIVT